jgi:hypothetical protein
MADISTLELDALWDEFHHAVNMTSTELSAWLQVSDVGETIEPLPKTAGSETGRHVLTILQKRRMDLTDDDIRVMREVVDAVDAQQDKGLPPKAGDVEWRHRLMELGHDPLKLA